MQLPVLGHTSPDLILYNQHTQLFKLLPQLLNVKAHKAVMYVYVGAVVNTLRLPCTYSSNAAAHLWAFRFRLFL